jgi:5'-nucleotidase/UDP-sugar diphosphatase
MRFAHTYLAVAALVCIFVLTGCEDDREPFQLRGQVRLTLLHTSDLHSRLYPYNLLVTHIDAQLGLGEIDTITNVGGAARISHILGRERARSGRVLHIDGGDCFQGAPIFNFFAGEAEIRTIAAMGADAQIVANHEFDKGALNLGIQLQKWGSYPSLVANYRLEDPAQPGASPLGSVIQPFQTFHVDGLKVAVIGMGNLSSLSSIYDQPNRLGVLPLKTSEVAQFYIDLLRPITDLIVFVTHLGLSGDQRLIEQTEGIDVVLGGHNHIVLQPPKLVKDCSNVDPACEASCRAANTDVEAGDECVRLGCHFIEVVSPEGQDPEKESKKLRRPCIPRQVVMNHSGAFAKYVGRLDVVASNDVNDLYPEYFPTNGFELLSHKFRLFPVNSQVPEDPIVRSLLHEYAAGLDLLVDLDLLVGYAPDGSNRFSASGEDSPLGNMIATAMWLRLGVQTDFSMTNTTGIRQNIVPGAVTVEQMFNVFPFDNSISKMQLSGLEMFEMFDFVARRSSGRGCTSQVQIAGARVVLDCAAPNEPPEGPGRTAAIYVGTQPNQSEPCASDSGCTGGIGSCDLNTGVCWQAIEPIASYEMATSNYLAGGGSGFRVLQRNTTQFDTKIQQRDAFTDYIRGGDHCGADPDGNAIACAVDSECVEAVGEGFVCACPDVIDDAADGQCIATAVTQCNKASGVPGPSDGACVLENCRTDMAQFNLDRCDFNPTEATRQKCIDSLQPCKTGGEQCKFLACIDNRIGNFSDGRVRMLQ